MSRAPSAASSHHAPSTAATAKGRSTQTSNTIGARSTIGLFVTNIRLLDLDGRSDWPEIILQTFSTKDAQQNQKNRIRCVEWALYRLFEIWDAEEARDKLQPFFPPLEPLQSLNLRAALYRCLNELKKNGVLGREVTLRKTMLDECKGEKFEEVLLVFSTAVLRKVVMARTMKPKYAPIAKRLATATSLGDKDRESLLPLAIAHRASLTALLKRKEAQRARYNELAELLDHKAQYIALRDKECQAALGDLVEPDLYTVKGRSIQNQLRENWLGNTKWLDVMLHGDQERAEDTFLRQPFPEVWNRVSQGQPLQNHEAPTGLLEDLERRVKEQKRRLEKWQAFHSTLAGSKKATTSDSHKTGSEFKIKEPSIKFDAHQKLKVGSTDTPASHSLHRSEISAPHVGMQYQAIIAAMREGMSQVSKSSRRGKPDRSGSTGGDGVLHKDSGQQDQAADQHTPEPEIKHEIPDTVEAMQAGASNTIGSEDQDVLSASVSDMSVQQATPSDSGSDMTPDEDGLQPPQDDAVDYDQAPDDNLPAPTLEEQLADQIITSIANAPPSPIKQPSLSLTERTRMSMAPYMPSSTSPPVPEALQEVHLPPPPSAVPDPTASGSTSTNRRTSLLDRTRESLFHASSRSHKQRDSIAKQERDIRRQSLYPINQFETPRKQEVDERGGRRDSTPKERLFAEDAHEGSVFKSRPKVALSPVCTPQAGDETAGSTWESSPLGRDGVGVRGRV